MQKIANELQGIRQILQQIHHLTPAKVNFDGCSAFVYQSRTRTFLPVNEVSAIPLDLLYAINHQKQLLLKNSLYLAHGLACNNVLLWGARGTGKSSLIKAVHQAINSQTPQQLLPEDEALKFQGKSKKPVKILEIHREDLGHLPDILHILRPVPHPFIIFCDDLSFESEDLDYKSLKAVLDGGIEGRPRHIAFYATSNRRHLMPRQMIENEQAGAIHSGEAGEEKISLSDRFGLWLGFYRPSEEDYLQMIGAYIQKYQLPIGEPQWRALAIEWSRTRGALSGRTAYQFICDLSANLGVVIE